MPAYFNLGSGYKEGFWHGEMTVFHEHLTATQAVNFAGMGFNYVLHPVYSEYPYYNESGELINIHRIPVENRFDLWREPIESDPEPRLVRSGVGNRYKLLQHSDMASILDPISEIWPVETVCVVKDWQISFITLRMEDYNVGGIEQENTRTYLHLSDDRSGPGSAFWGITTLREGCYNTYLAAMSTAREMHRIPHGGNVMRELQFRADLALHALSARSESLAQLDIMIKHALEETELDQMLVAAFPHKKDPRDLKLVRIIPVGAESEAIAATRAAGGKAEKWKAKRDATADLLRQEALLNFAKFNDEQPYAANTVYAGFQAITETINHSNLYRGNKAKQMTNILIGDRGEAMDRAFGTALELVKA